MKTFAMLLIIVFIASGCALLQTKIFNSSYTNNAEARQVLEKIKNNNKTLKTFKGNAKIKFIYKEQVFSSHLYFACALPGKLRIILTDTFGRPIANLASDAKWIYVISSEQKKLHKKRMADSSLKIFFGIPIDIYELIATISGRIKIGEYKSVSLLPNSNFEDEYILILKRDNLKTKIHIDSNKTIVKKIEQYNFLNEKIFTTELSQYQDINGYKIPLKILLTANAKKKCISINIDKYFTNVCLKDSIFTFTPK